MTPERRTELIAQLREVADKLDEAQRRQDASEIRGGRTFVWADTDEVIASMMAIRAIASDLEGVIGEALREVPEVCSCITPTESPGSLDCAVCGGDVRRRFDRFDR